MSQYLHKNTMAEMRALTSPEIAAVLDDTYVGVMLHGYYAYGDTPAAITYYKSSTTLADDQGSVIVIGTLTLEHKFSVCDMAYYGLQTATNTAAVADRNTLVINNALKIAPKVIITQPGEYFCRGNRGGEGGAYQYFVDPTYGAVAWQMGNGQGQSESTLITSGIDIPSNRTFEMGDDVTLHMRGTFMQCYNFINVWQKENVIIRGGKVIGDFDLDPELNQHKGLDPADHWHYGKNDGGEWGFGIIIQGSKNVLIENVDISHMWADGLYISPDYLNNYQVSTDVTFVNVKSHHNRRQGLSVNGGLRLSFYNCEFSDSKGTAPESGVDLERDSDISSVHLKDVLFFDCKFLNNNNWGAVTAQREDEELNVRFENCIFDGNVVQDYYGSRGNGVAFTSCRFGYQPSRFYSIKLDGAYNHTFDKCEFGNAIQVIQKVIEVDDNNYLYYRSKNITFTNSKILDLRLRSSLFEFIDLGNSINVRIQDCYFESTTIQDDRRLIISNGGENIELLNNTVRELGSVFDVQNIVGFRFNNNVVINSQRVTGILRGNVKYFELCDNTISGNSYYVTNAFAPAFMLWGAGSAYGRISDNVIYKDPIFTTVGVYAGQGSGLYREYTSASDNVVVANNKTYDFTNSNAFQFNGGSTNLSVSYLNQEADTTYKGIVNQSVAISTISTANATDASTTQALVNELKAKINTLITDQKTAGLIKV
ncbi:right-handed parallel beta-helix repeat-containing protein [Dyadobacter sp. LHD-138]|uniref:right-handed parallel beta-helix repeat-containing protein n=1 Tax=Dyadobacter sp. LHD-138 TaxID=3071413 RepID=UPI0027E08AD7|nr:right-handed parallel beta-helix repeat-containing protein [Dyadobacter sp. LHD-138]MDQ6477810.1 right-handed parallel beta-helix repeat-containing protein [Dyadobacter sp. LHD-138]